jgi:hypothetical protein
VTRGQRVFRKGVWFTKAAYGPVMVIAWWGARYKEPVTAKFHLQGVY